jgi:hypothetical protein
LFVSFKTIKIKNRIIPSPIPVDLLFSII